MNYANQWNVKSSILETKNQKKPIPLLFKKYLSMKLLNFIKGTGGTATEAWSWPLTSVSYDSYETRGFT